MKQSRRSILVIGLLLLTAALVWAAVELSGQVNALAQDAGRHSADMEMIALKSIKKPIQVRGTASPPPCDWAAERKINAAIEANDAQYRELITLAQKETRAKGRPGESTSKAVLEKAAAFQGLTEQYAAMWEACGCITRAKTSRATGQSRIKSALVAASEFDQARHQTMGQAQDGLLEAHAQYAQAAITDQEIGVEDKQDIKNTLVPQAESLIERINQYISDIQKLRGEVQSNLQGGGSGSEGGGGHGGERSAAGLSPASRQAVEGLTSLRGGGIGLANRAQRLKQHLIALIAGQWSVGGLNSLACFLDTIAD